MKPVLVLIVLFTAFICNEQPANAARKLTACFRQGPHCRQCKRNDVCEKCDPGFKLVNPGKQFWKCVLPLPKPTIASSTCPPAANRCRIDAHSYSLAGGSLVCGVTPLLQLGTVRLNGEPVTVANLCNDTATFGSSLPGVRLVTIDPVACKVLNVSVFQTGAVQGDAKNLANNLTSAAPGTLVAAITADEPSLYIGPAAAALKSACNVDITSLVSHGSFAFVCQVGNPNATTSQVLGWPSTGAFASATVSGPPGKCQVFNVNLF